MSREPSDLPRGLTVDVLLSAGHVVADSATVATVTMPAVPTTADALADLPLLLGGRDSGDVADDFVTRDQGVLRLREDAVLRRFITVRETCQHQASQASSFRIDVWKRRRVESLSD